jgi:hypothetical protein
MTLADPFLRTASIYANAWLPVCRVAVLTALGWITSRRQGYFHRLSHFDERQIGVSEDRSTSGRSMA